MSRKRNMPLTNEQSVVMSSAAIALSCPKRIFIAMLLLDGEKTFLEIGNKCREKFPGLSRIRYARTSKNLAYMIEHGLIMKRRSGRNSWYSLNESAVPLVRFVAKQLLKSTRKGK